MLLTDRAISYWSFHESTNLSVHELVVVWFHQSFSYQHSILLIKSIKFVALFIVLTVFLLFDYWSPVDYWVTHFSKEFFMISLVYIAIGLSLNTITIDIMGQYLKQVHYFGRKLTDVAKTHIWFGGKRCCLSEGSQRFSVNMQILGQLFKESCNHLLKKEV